MNVGGALLAARARVVVAAAPRHGHALRQLRRALGERQVDLVEPDALAATAADADLLVVLADPTSPPPVELASAAELGALPQDGLLLRTARLHGRPALLAAGGGRAGVIHAVDELLRRHLRPRDDVLELPALALRQTPALPYRLFWTWDHSTNWFLDQVGQQEIGALNPYAKPADGFLQDYRRMVDFMSLHRIGGVIVYGFLRDGHGGVEAAQELCRYAGERGVRIVPGVGINAYGGIYWEGKHPYNLSDWLHRHPELRATLAKPPSFEITDFPQLSYPESQYTDAACPSKPENARYHQEAIRWLVETFEIGGINYESGDYGVCACPDCTARRGAGSGDWSLQDMLLLYPDLFEAARAAKPDLWLICEAYYDSILDLDAVTPLGRLPADVIYQLTISRSYWQRVRRELTRAHVSRLPQRTNVLSTHMGSQWNHERYELLAPRFAELMRLVIDTGMQGATIWGEVGAFSTVNEINYLAFARFAWDAELTWERFVAEELGPLLGGVEAAERYLALLVVPPEAEALAHAAGEAREHAAAQSGEPYRRWLWLQQRLVQKQAMLPA